MTQFDLSDLQLKALQHLAKHEFSEASNIFDVGFYSPGRRAQTNTLMSLVRLGLAEHRYGSRWENRRAEWWLTDAGRTALSHAEATSIASTGAAINKG